MCLRRVRRKAELLGRSVEELAQQPAVEPVGAADAAFPLAHQAAGGALGAELHQAVRDLVLGEVARLTSLPQQRIGNRLVRGNHHGRALPRRLDLD
jgi:hypothetical protein